MKLLALSMLAVLALVASFGCNPDAEYKAQMETWFDEEPYVFEHDEFGRHLVKLQTIEPPRDWKARHNDLYTVGKQYWQARIHEQRTQEVEQRLFRARRDYLIPQCEILRHIAASDDYVEACLQLWDASDQWHDEKVKFRRVLR